MYRALPPLMARPAQPTTGMNPAAAMAPAAIRSASDSLRPVTGSTPVEALIESKYPVNSPVKVFVV
nr:hypothetical protein [Peribacillus simplex]